MEIGVQVVETYVAKGKLKQLLYIIFAVCTLHYRVVYGINK